MMMMMKRSNDHNGDGGNVDDEQLGERAEEKLVDR